MWKDIKEGGRQFGYVYLTKERVARCRGKLHLPVIGFWDKVIFSDECKVEIGANKRVYVWRRAGEEWDSAYLNTRLGGNLE